MRTIVELIASMKTNVLPRSIRLCFQKSGPVQSSLLIFPLTMTSSRFQFPFANSSLSIVDADVTYFVKLFEAKGICNLQK